jgi:CheY-like chemotaxis protein
MMKFLVVDDEKDVEMLFRQKFRKEIKRKEIEMQFAFSGKEALEILEAAELPDVIYVFSDINMPGMSGLDLLDTIRDKYPNIKVCMISAYGDSDNVERAINSGARGFFTKPIDFKSLKKEIGQMIGKSAGEGA